MVMNSQMTGEFLGSFMLAFAVEMIITPNCIYFGEGSDTASNPLLNGEADYLGTVGIAAALTCVTYCFWKVSGSHLNPAISLASAMCQRMSYVDAGMYMAAQMMGSLFGAMSALGVFGHACNLEPSPAFANKVPQVLATEMFLTAMLVLVFLCVSSKVESVKDNEYYGLAMGFTFLSVAYGGGWISGAVCNPALALAMDLSSAGVGFGWCFPYAFAAFVGAGVAAVLFPKIHADEFEARVVAAKADRCWAEGVGSFFLVFAMGLNWVNPSTQTTGLAIGAALIGLVKALAPVSGGHFNPAVSVAVFFGDRKRWSQQGQLLLNYVVCQGAGGAAGALAYSWIAGQSLPDSKKFTVGPPDYQIPGIGDEFKFGWLQYSAVEGIFTMVLCFVTLCVLTTEQLDSESSFTEMHGLAIGMAQTAGFYAGQVVGGGGLNPMMAVGKEIAYAARHGHISTDFNTLLTVLLVQFSGAFAAVGLFVLTHPKEFRMWANSIPETLSKAVSEFLGIFVVVFTTGCIVCPDMMRRKMVDGQPTLEPHPIYLDEPDYLGTFAIAAVYMSLVYSLGFVSGAHFNPAITLATKALSGMDWNMVGVYIFSQILGAFAGAFAYLGLYGVAFALAPGAGFFWLRPCVAELLGTFIITIVYLSVHYCPSVRGNEYFGIAVAFATVGGMYGAGWISGGVFNPASALAMDAASAATGFGWCGAYAVAQIIGALLAALAYRVLHPHEFGGRAPGPREEMIAEGIGCFCLVFVFGLNALNPSVQTTVLAVATTTVSLVCAFHANRGGQLNPGITLAYQCHPSCTRTTGDCFKIIGVQLSAGVAAGITYGLLMGPTVVTDIGRGLAALGPSSFAMKTEIIYTWGEVGSIEVLFTALLTLTVLTVMPVSRDAEQSDGEAALGLAYGFAMMAGGYAGRVLGAGSLNPAISLGKDFAHQLYWGGFGGCFHYLWLQLLGAMLGAGLYLIFDKKLLGVEEPVSKGV
mmetsp:Transcript_88542/g.236617  ORF Transcript_88542/g.236617 Transcript_88542/m.236617 type:complete len:977 (-) Transcript_88542:74-3004(-)